jgi:hypothetical protein
MLGMENQCIVERMPGPREVRQIQAELYEIQKPFHRLAIAVMNSSPHTIFMTRGNLLSETVYPAETRELLDEIYAMRDAAVQSHLARWKRNYTVFP